MLTTAHEFPPNDSILYCVHCGTSRAQAAAGMTMCRTREISTPAAPRGSMAADDFDAIRARLAELQGDTTNVRLENDK